MRYKFCDNCGEYADIENHECKPEWQAVLIDFQDECDCEKSFGFSFGQL